MYDGVVGELRQNMLGFISKGFCNVTYVCDGGAEARNLLELSPESAGREIKGWHAALLVGGERYAILLAESKERKNLSPARTGAWDSGL
jgi:hypothetical protein